MRREVARARAWWIPFCNLARALCRKLGANDAWKLHLTATARNQAVVKGRSVIVQSCLADDIVIARLNVLIIRTA